jgi:hypothetical protein
MALNFGSTVMSKFERRAFDDLVEPGETGRLRPSSSASWVVASNAPTES